MRCQKCGAVNSDKALICCRCTTSFSEGANAREKRRIEIFDWVESENKKDQEEQAKKQREYEEKA